VNAVKHTEGGGAAAQSITGDIPDGINVPIEDTPDAAEAKGNELFDPMTQSDYQEMLAVLSKDAAEAEDVVLEIQERIADMESVLENVSANRDALVSIYNATTDVYEHLSTLATTRLPEFIAQAHTFTRIWNEEHDRIRTGMADLSDLRALYHGFLDAYDGLILEVSRRKHVRQGVERILRETRARLEQAYEEDMNAREAFRVEQGDYLPSDIWPGLGRGPMRIKFSRVPGGKLSTVAGQTEDDAAAGSNHLVEESLDDGADEIPDLPKHVVDEAIARLKARAKGDILG
jgi:autophagy-related protein 17